MAFISSITEDSFQADVFREGKEYSIHVHVGYDDSENKTYSVVVGLSPIPPGEYEYYFALIEVDADTDSERMIWDGRQTKEIIGETERREILRVVMGLTKGLLDQVKPPIFYMATHGEYLPDRAMTKYRALHQVFRDCGYNITQTDPYHGKRSWWMDK